jgi:ABC-2 type transport system ATP-binding protein
MIVEVKELTKAFGHKKVLDSISFQVFKGSIVGIVGPNGSGKTTLLNILIGSLGQDFGWFNFSELLQIGMSISRNGFFDDMTVKNNLLLIARLCNTSPKSVMNKIEEFQIDFYDSTFRHLSAGMKQRVALVVPFLKKQDLVLLDEPTNHLDIESIIFLRKKILDLKTTGVSFVITSHILSDLEKVCDQIIFMKKGKILVNQSKEKLVLEYGSIEDAYLKFVN